MRRLLLAAVLTGWGVAGLACGGSKSDPPPAPDTGSSPATGIVLHGGERLGWSQAAGSLEEARAYRYRLYVDDVRRDLSGVSCEPQGGLFDCAAPLPALSPGTHQLRLSAANQNGESVRSAPLQVTVVQNVTSASAPAESSAATEPTFDPCDSPGQNAFPARTVTLGTAAVASLAVLPDGRVLVAQIGGGISILNPSLQTMVLARSWGSEVVGASLAVDPRFVETRRVFASVTEFDGSFHSVRIERYRELGDALGETATIVPDIRVTSSAANARLAVGNRLLLALPIDSAGEKLGENSYGGTVLQWELDGSVPRDAIGASPVLTRGYDRPAGIVAPLLSSVAWIAGSGGPLGEGVSAVETAPEAPHRAAVPLEGEMQGFADFVAAQDASDLRAFVLEPSGTVVTMQLWRVGRLRGTGERVKVPGVESSVGRYVAVSGRSLDVVFGPRQRRSARGDWTLTRIARAAAATGCSSD